jgi:hypothetical protein
VADFGKYAVEITAKTAQFQAEMARAAAGAESASKRMSSAFSSVRTGLAALGGTAALIGFGALIKGVIDAEDHLQDLSKSTGVAVKTLGGIGFAAKQSGSDLDEAAKAFGKLNLRIAAATAGNQEAAKAFQVIGISIDELKNSSPDQIFARLADQFASYEDGANKAALGNALFGKSYQGIIPLLDEGGDKLRQNIAYFQRYGLVTDETAAKADQFNDTLVKLKLLNSAFTKTIAAELLPAMQSLADELVRMRENSTAAQTAAGDIANVIKAIAVAAIYGAVELAAFADSLGAVGAAAVSLAKLDFAAVKAIWDAADAEQERRTQTRDRLIKSITDATQVAARPASAAAPGKRQAPSLGSTDTDDTARKLLDQRIKALDAAISEERDILKTREHFLQAYYQDDQLGIKEYFDKRQQIIADALGKEIAAYDEEIAVLRAFAERANPKDRVDTETKIADVVAKRSKAQRDASISGVQLWIDEQKAAQGFRDKLEEISLKLLEMQGDSVAAASFGFDIANRELQKRIDLERQSSDEQARANAETLASKLADYRKLIIQQAQLNDLQKQFSLIITEVGNAQASIAAKREAGTITELEALAQISVANKARIADLTKVAEAYEAVARATGDKSALVAAETLRVEIEKLAATGDLVAKKFNDVFVSAFTDGLTEIVTGTKSVKDAFLSMEKSIVAAISRIAAQNIAEKIFGGSGGIGDLFSKLFGGSSSSGGFDFGAILKDIFGGGLAGGGMPPLGKVSLVGEKGPELFVPRGVGTIVPISSASGYRGQSIVINVNVPQSTSGASADQIAQRTGAAVSRAMSRNG